MQRQEKIFEANLFKEYLKSKVIALLDSIPGKKLLMLDSSVFTPINLVVEKRVYAEHNVPEEGGIQGFQPIAIDNNFSQIVIFLPPTIKSMETLVELYNRNKDRGNKTYYPVFWPKRTAVCKQYLEARGLLSSFNLRDFSFDLIPLDNDLYSLEMKCFKQLYIDNEYSIYNVVAESIHRLQCVFGKVRNIFGKGTAARNIYQILNIKQNEIKIDDVYGDIQNLIIFDRNIDFVTPLLRQMTYEGMIDEFYGINGNLVKLPVDLLEEPRQRQNANPYKTIALNGERDYIFDEIRILNISACRSLLNKKLLALTGKEEAAKETKDLAVKKELTKQVTVEKELLQKHVNITSALHESMKTISFHKELMMMQRLIMGSSDKEIIEYYENMIPFGVPLEKLMRPLCMYSVVEKGIPKKVYRSLCQDIIQCYGAQHIISLSYMAKLGLFCEQGSVQAAQTEMKFSEVRKELKLIFEDTINHENPTNVSFAYGGYASICAKLVEHAMRNGWKEIPKGLKLLPGDTLMPDVIQPCLSAAKPVTLVYFVGGVTYSEIAAIRLLGRIFKKEMVIATTEVLNGDSMLRSLIESAQ